MIFYFLEFILKNFYFGVLQQAVRAVSKNRPKYPLLDIPIARINFAGTHVTGVVFRNILVKMSDQLFTATSSGQHLQSVSCCCAPSHCPSL
jgi:hypothetical protein